MRSGAVARFTAPEHQQLVVEKSKQLMLQSNVFVLNLFQQRLVRDVSVLSSVTICSGAALAPSLGLTWIPRVTNMSPLRSRHLEASNNLPTSKSLQRQLFLDQWSARLFYSSHPNQGEVKTAQVPRQRGSTRQPLEGRSAPSRTGG